VSVPIVDDPDVAAGGAAGGGACVATAAGGGDGGGGGGAGDGGGATVVVGAATLGTADAGAEARMEADGLGAGLACVSLCDQTMSTAIEQMLTMSEMAMATSHPRLPRQIALSMEKTDGPPVEDGLAGVHAACGEGGGSADGAVAVVVSALGAAGGEGGA
jgi:hypothetical protein